MSRKDYRAFAAILAEAGMYSPDPDGAAPTINLIAHGMAGVFERDNRRFDRARFFSAAGLPAYGSSGPTDKEGHA
jgi:hypothetical protein